MSPSFSRFSFLLAAFAAVSFAHDEPVAGPNPSSHGPAGVMADHVHAKGEGMVGYTYMTMPMSGLRAGTATISEDSLAALGYSMAPRSMDMEMHMFHLMYAPWEKVTLMLMPTYVRMDMKMVALPGSMSGGHGGHAGGPAMAGSIHEHSTSGWGDTTVAALVSFWQRGDHRLSAQLAFSVPTGKVDLKDATGKFTHYGMQLGSGTWDLLPGLTYTGSSGRLSWGAQTELTLRLEHKNTSGYQRGNVTRSTGWVAWRAAAWASLSMRLDYRHEGRLTGHYNGGHNHSSPPDLQANYGGETLEAGLGLNLVCTKGLLRGHRLGMEILRPIHEETRGIQLGLDHTCSIAWSKAF